MAVYNCIKYEFTKFVELRKKEREERKRRRRLRLSILDPT
jgi:hypothetical protein